MKNLLIAITLIIIFSGCVKTTMLSFGGIVVDDAGLPVEGAVVTYFGHHGASGCSDGEFGAIASANTDAEGRFVMTVRVQKEVGKEFFKVASGNKGITFNDTLGGSNRNMRIVLK